MGLRKRQSAEKIKEAKKQVAFAKLNNCPTSPRKMRIVADSVRGKKVEMALTILKFSQKNKFSNQIICAGHFFSPYFPIFGGVEYQNLV